MYQAWSNQVYLDLKPFRSFSFKLLFMYACVCSVVSWKKCRHCMKDDDDDDEWIIFLKWKYSFVSSCIQTHCFFGLKFGWIMFNLFEFTQTLSNYHSLVDYSMLQKTILAWVKLEWKNQTIFLVFVLFSPSKYIY